MRIYRYMLGVVLVVSNLDGQAPVDFTLVAGNPPLAPGTLPVFDLATGANTFLGHLTSAGCPGGQVWVLSIDHIEEAKLIVGCTLVHSLVPFVAEHQLGTAVHQGSHLRSVQYYRHIQVAGDYPVYVDVERIGRDLVTLVIGLNSLLGTGTPLIQQGLYVISPWPTGSGQLLSAGWNPPISVFGGEVAVLDATKAEIHFVDLATGASRRLNSVTGVHANAVNVADMIALGPNSVLVAFREGYVGAISDTGVQLMFSFPNAMPSRSILHMARTVQYGVVVTATDRTFYRGDPITGDLVILRQVPFSLEAVDFYRAPTPVNWIYGTGCPGGQLGFIPDIIPLSTPTLGSQTFGIQVQVATPGAPAWLALGWNRVSWNGLPLPLDLGPHGFPGCTLYVRPDAVHSSIIDSAGTATVPLPIPNTTTLINAQVHSQWLLFDPYVPLSMTPPLLSEIK